MNTLARAEALAPKLYGIREQIHRHPEFGNQEFATAALIEETLQSAGIETRRVTETGILGILRGAEAGPAAALRADMDALPITENSGAEFASEIPGHMHACGHDIHVTAALGAALLLAERRDELRGEARFFFEPDEEGSGGAARMVAAGCMEGVEAVFGAHVVPDLPEGVIGVRYGKFYAASDIFSVSFRGRSAHGAQPEDGIDALAAAAEAVTRLRGLPAALLNDPAVLSIGIFHAGTADNIIADSARFSGTMRTLGPADRACLKEAFRKTVGEVSEKFGTAHEIVFRESYGGIVNTDEESRIVQETAGKLFGKDFVRVIEKPTMKTEDFGCFIDAAKGAFYHIGAGCGAPLHNPEFLPVPYTIIRLAALHADIIGHYLL